MSKFVSLALAMGFFWTQAQAAIAVPSPAQATSIVNKADVEYCYWKVKKNGKLKLKCDD
ncbi:MAG TPA: hypothetical protein VHK26_05420 [Methyloceanibacter sp.]|nr:hypothetical protein [Methyloceanibacter sp.]